MDRLQLVALEYPGIHNKVYHKKPKNSDTQKIAVIILKTVLFYHRVTGSKDVDGMANSVDPYQTAPLGGV